MTTDMTKFDAILEIRPRLQSVNVFITLAEPISAKCKENNRLKIILNESNIELIVANDDDDNDSTTLLLVIPCDLITSKIVRNSLSSLIISENNFNISFRFTTDNYLNDFGTFKMELLQVTQSLESTHLLRRDDDTFLRQSVDYTVRCGTCAHALNDEKFLNFPRLLPLPSEQSDAGDWFCHAHASQSPITTVNDNSGNPINNICFYSQCYVHLNRDLISNENILVINDDNDVVQCKNCLAWLGTIIHNSQMIKLWFNTVDFHDNASDNNKTVPLEDAFRMIKDVLATSILFNAVKLVLTCSRTNNTTIGRNVDRLLIWVLEKQLDVVQLLRMRESTNKRCRVAKVLFKLVVASGDNDYDDGIGLLNDWKNDSSVVYLSVSKPMFDAVLKHLDDFNQMIPIEFNQSNKFFVSYLMMYD